MEGERKALINEMRTFDKRLQLISKPFGGYKNIIELDDIHLEDPFLTSDAKNWLKVSSGEESFNSLFNKVVNTMGLKNTKWGKLSIYMFALWSIMTSVTCF